MKARALIRNGTARLKNSPAIDHWQKGREKIEAEILLIDLMGEEPDPDDKISASKQRRYEEWIERRFTGEPVAHITGVTDFRGLDLIVKPGVFVPRDSSEWLAEQAIRRLRKRRKPVHVDLASGMGTIALAVASEVPKAEVFGAELSREGVKLARRNARELGLKATFAAGDLFEPVPKKLRGRVDVITIHPPYVAKNELKDLPDEIRRGGGRVLVESHDLLHGDAVPLSDRFARRFPRPRCRLGRRGEARRGGAHRADGRVGDRCAVGWTVSWAVGPAVSGSPSPRFPSCAPRRPSRRGARASRRSDRGSS